MTAPKILLVEDDVNLGFVIKDNLEMNGGFQVRLCEDGEEGWQAFLQEAFDVCVLDVMLPKKDGFSLAESIRSKNEFVPIIFLTAKGMKEDKITGFKVGADDYMTKPFSIEELILRIQVCLKHTKRQTNTATQSDNAYYLGTYNFDYHNLTLNHTNEVVTLTQKEADVLRLFCRHKGKVLKREEILQPIWGNDSYFSGRSLDVFISKLRKYLQHDPQIEIINIHGVGFKLDIKPIQEA
jgi:DNA-binding response OmpR family regulator